MAKNMDSAQQSRTTTVAATKEKTLVLRHKAESLKKDMRDKLPKELFKDAKRSSEKEAKAAMSTTLEEFRSNFNTSIDSMQAEILSHAPVKPIRQQAQTEEELKKLEEQYEQDLADFKVYSEEATRVVEAVVEIIKKTLDRLLEFSQYLWEMVTANDPQIDKKCKEFMSKLAKEIEEGFSTDPESSAVENTETRGRPCLASDK